MVLRRSDGSLYDVAGQRPITASELRDHVSDGGLFEARREDSNADCTLEVLSEIAGAGAPEQLVPGVGNGALSALSALSGWPNTGGAGAERPRRLTRRSAGESSLPRQEGKKMDPQGDWALSDEP